MGSADILTAGFAKPWLLFWIVVILSHGYMDYRMYLKFRGWGRGLRQMGGGGGNRMRVVKIWLSEVFLQRQLLALSFLRWLIHVLIFWGFIGLASLSVFTVFLRPLTWLGIGKGLTHYFLNGHGYVIIKAWGDGFGLALLIGLFAAFARRLLFRPAQQINEQMDIALLGLLLWLTLSGFFLEWLRLPLLPAEVVRYSVIGQLIEPLNAYAYQLRPWLTAAWTIHGLSGAALLVYLPSSKLMHSILAPLVIALNASGEHERKDLYWPDARKHRATESHQD